MRPVTGEFSLNIGIDRRKEVQGRSMLFLRTSDIKTWLERDSMLV